MKTPIVGLHHVTAIASNPQQNLDFYTQVLGLRFVKRTVNFDDPGTYHFYFGDDSGAPGTILTFFPWPHARRGLPGVGETSRTAFSVPVGSLDYWRKRLIDNDVLFEETGKRFEEEVLTLADSDGMRLELVAHETSVATTPSRFADVPAEFAIRGFFGVTLVENTAGATAATLEMMGYRKLAEGGDRLRYVATATEPGEALGNVVDLVIDPSAGFGRFGAGSVHHIAFRASDDDAQAAWREEIAKTLQVTGILDRQYFHSIYFREPGGVLFELATDNPGFATDETLADLGEALKLPSWLEPQRESIEARVWPITLNKKEVQA